MTSAATRKTLLAEVDRLVLSSVALCERGAKLDPVTWAQAALGLQLDEWQRQIMHSGSDRLVVVAARQSGKSVITGAKAAFEAQTRPGLRVVVVAPSFRQAGLLADKIEDALIHSGNPPARKREALSLPNGSRVVVLPGDRASTVRGHTADLLVVDELGFARTDLTAAILPMLQASGGRLVAISSPNGPTGLLYELSRAEGVEVIRVPAGEVSHFDPAVVSELRGRLGPQMARQELDAEFVASSASVFDGDTLAAMFDPDPGALSALEDQPDPDADILETRLRQQDAADRRRNGTHWMDL
jgi:hypothetical protein